MSSLMQASEAPPADYGATSTTTANRFQLLAQQIGEEGYSIYKALQDQTLDHIETIKAADKGLNYLSILGGACMIGASVCGLVFRSGIFDTVIQVYIAIFGLAICALELKTGPLSQSKYKMFVFEYFHFLFTMYGRAIFYVFCTTILLAQWPYFVDSIVGCYMGALSFIYITVGFKSNKKLKSFKIDSEEAASTLFEEYATDDDVPVLTKETFKRLCLDNNKEFTDQEIEAALMLITDDTKGSATKKEFMDWYKSNNVQV